MAQEESWKSQHLSVGQVELVPGNATNIPCHNKRKRPFGELLLRPTWIFRCGQPTQPRPSFSVCQDGTCLPYWSRTWTGWHSDGAVVDLCWSWLQAEGTIQVGARWPRCAARQARRNKGAWSEKADCLWHPEVLHPTAESAGNQNRVAIAATPLELCTWQPVADFSPQFGRWLMRGFIMLSLWLSHSFSILFRAYQDHQYFRYVSFLSDIETWHAFPAMMGAVSHVLLPKGIIRLLNGSFRDQLRTAVRIAVSRTTSTFAYFCYGFSDIETWHAFPAMMGAVSHVLLPKGIMRLLNGSL